MLICTHKYIYHTHSRTIENASTEEGNEISRDYCIFTDTRYIFTNMCPILQYAIFDLLRSAGQGWRTGARDFSSSRKLDRNLIFFPYRISRKITPFTDRIYMDRTRNVCRLEREYARTMRAETRSLFFFFLFFFIFFF